MPYFRAGGSFLVRERNRPKRLKNNKRRLPDGEWDYSYRSATVGSRRTDFLVGRYVARAAMVPITNTTRRIVTGSYGDSPNSRFTASRDAAIPPAKPTTTPIVTIHVVSRMMVRTTCQGFAPSAMRIPISRVLRLTLFDVTPYSPIAAMNKTIVSRDADDFDIHPRGVESETRANRTPLGEELSRENLIYDGNARSILMVAAIERTAFHDRNAKSLKEGASHTEPPDGLSLRLDSTSGHVDIRMAAAGLHQRVRRTRRSNHTR
jgi:hypothetical protein